MSTLYVSNLPSKIAAADLTALLFDLFSTAGDVIGVRIAKAAKKRAPNQKIRGTAFVSFRNQEHANAALKKLGKFDFFGKQLTVQYATANSDVAAKYVDQFKPRFKPVKPVVDEDDEAME